MVTQINDKKAEKKAKVFNNFNDFIIDENLEEERYLVDEKKMQMINLESKIDALGLFGINLRELENSDENRLSTSSQSRFEADLHQNLELWDSLMKSIDNLYFSDDGSFDVDIERKHSSDFSSDKSSASLRFESYTKRKDSILSIENSIDYSIEPKYGITINAFNANERNYLSYEMSQMLIIYNKYLEDFFIARDNTGRIGLVFEFNVDLIKDETYVKSVCAYEGLDAQELTFPNNALIRVLRTNIKTKRNDGEEWMEGAYQGKIGFFPAIFVQEMTNENVKRISYCEESLNSTIDQKVP